MPVTHQPAPYEHLGWYDTPEVLASLTAQGKLTVAGAKAAIFDPMALTPEERQTYTRELQAAAGGSRITNTLVGLATNPWVWLAVVTSSVGGDVASDALRAGRRIFQPAAHMSVLMREKAPLLSAIGVTSPLNDWLDTATIEGLKHVGSRINQLHVEDAKLIGDSYERLLKQYRVGTLDPARVLNPKKRAAVERLNTLLTAKLHGWDQEWTEVLVKERDGKYIRQHVKHTPLIDGNLDDMLRAEGGEEAIDFANRVGGLLKKRAEELFGDEQRRLRLYGLITNPVFRQGKEDSAGLHMLNTIMGSVLDGVREGTITKREFLDLLDDVVMTPVRENKFYFPRNISEVYAGGKRVEVFREKALKGLGGPGATINRRVGQVLWHEDDLAAVQGVVEGLGGKVTSAFDEMLTSSRAAMRATVDNPNQQARFFRLNAQRSLEKFNDSAYRFTALSDEPTVRMYETNARTRLEGMSKVNDPTVSELFHPPLGSGVGASTKVPMRDIPDELRPAGGFSVADAMYADVIYVPDKGTREGLQNIVLPRVLGQRTDEAYALQSVMYSAKKTARGFADSGLGKVIEEQGGSFGQAFVGSLRNWADLDMVGREASSLNHAMASYLYGTHLGFNMSSMVLNALQPLLQGPSWLGVGAMVEGYATAFKQMSAWAAKRAKLGAFPSALEQRKLAEEVFGDFITADGEDLLSIAPDVIETLESHTLGRRGAVSSLSNYHQLGGQARRWLVDVPLAPFQKVEWFNRLVIGNAVKAKYRKVGAPTLTKEMMHQDIRDAVAFTQFGGDMLNTPVMFQRGLLSNPLMRQFMNFPLRSATVYFTASPQLGGRTTPVRAGLHDFLRAMGTSAIIYEVGKGMLGANLERGLAASAATDIYPFLEGGRFDERDSIVPVPPIIDIPANLVKGVLGDDVDAFAYNLPRLLPAGVAVLRLLNTTAPDLGVVTQRTYVDWKAETPEGMVPTFKGDGTFIAWRGRDELILKGLGADLGRFQAEGELTGYLNKQATEIRQYKQQAVRALMAGDTKKVNEVRAEFEKRFGLPLTITKQHLRAAVKQRETPRATRVLERLPSEYREEYANIMPFMGEGQTPAGVLRPALPTGDPAMPADASHVPAPDPDLLQLLQQQAAAQPFER